MRPRVIACVSTRLFCVRVHRGAATFDLQPHAPGVEPDEVRREQDHRPPAVRLVDARARASRPAALIRSGVPYQKMKRSKKLRDEVAEVPARHLAAPRFAPVGKAQPQIGERDSAARPRPAARRGSPVSRPDRRTPGCGSRAIGAAAAAAPRPANRLRPLTADPRRGTLVAVVTPQVLRRQSADQALASRAFTASGVGTSVMRSRGAAASPCRRQTLAEREHDRGARSTRRAAAAASSCTPVARRTAPNRPRPASGTWSGSRPTVSPDTQRAQQRPHAGEVGRHRTHRRPGCAPPRAGGRAPPAWAA